MTGHPDDVGTIEVAEPAVVVLWRPGCPYSAALRNTVIVWRASSTRVS